MDYIKLKDVTIFVRNGASIKQNKTNKDGYPITRIETLSNNVFNYDKLGYASITTEEYADYYLKNGDVLLSHINSEKFLGRSLTYFNRGEGPIIHGMNLLCIRFISNKYNPKYFEYYTKTQVAKNYFAENTKHAVNQASITSTAIKDMPIPNTTLSVQNNIVQKLDIINENISLKKKQLIHLDELIKSRFIEQFEKYSKIELHTISKITMGQSPDSSSYNDDGNGVPFFQGKGDYGDKYTIVKHYTTSPKKIAKKDSVLMSVRAPVGPVNIANVDCCIGRGLCSVDAIEGLTNNEFIYNALNAMQDEISGKGNGSTFNAINKDDVYKLRIPNAPINEQDEFSEFVKQIDKSKFVNHSRYFL